MQKLVFTNGGGQTIDLTSVLNGGNFGITNWEGLSGVGLNIQTQQVPFQDGGVFLDALMEQREISVTVAIQDNNDLSLRYELKRQLISALNPKLGEGVLVYTNDYLSRQIKAVPQLPIFENKNSNDAGTLKASVVFSCPSPYWEDLEETEISINGQDTINNNGDVNIGISLKLYAGIKKPQFINQTQRKSITINKDLNNDILINTQVGLKSVNEEKIKFEFNQGVFDFKSMTYGLNNIIFVGDGIILTQSQITKKMTTIEYPEYYFNKVKYFNDFGFIAVGARRGVNNDSIAILTSKDGYNWNVVYGTQLETIGVANSLELVSNNIVVIGNNGIILTSTDLESWNIVTSQYFTNVDLLDISYYYSFIVIVGKNGFVFSGRNLNQGSIHNIEGVTEDLYSISHSTYYTRFIIVGNSGRIIYAGYNYSGVNIIGTETKENNDFIYINCKENKVFIVEKNRNYIYTNDLTNWNEVQTDARLNEIQFVTYEYIAIGYRGYIAHSTDCIEWNNNNSQFIDKNIKSIEYVEKYNQFICIYDITEGGRINSYLLVTQNNGNSWIQKNIAFQKKFINTLYVEEKNIYIVYGDGVYISNNLEEWEEVFSVGISSLIYSKEKDIFVAVGYNGLIVTSINLIDWTFQTSGTTEELLDVCYSKKNDLFIAVGRNKSLLISNNAVDWQSITLNIPDNTSILTIACSDNGRFVAGCTNGYRIISVDGYNWITKRLPENTVMRNIRYINGIFYMFFIKQYNTYLFSSYVEKSIDGINEIGLIYSITNSFWLDIAFSKKDNFYFLASESGLMKSNITDINYISNIESNSDMTIGLDIGENSLLFLTENEEQIDVILKYRQKYIGV